MAILSCKDILLVLNPFFGEQYILAKPIDGFIPESEMLYNDIVPHLPKKAEHMAFIKFSETNLLYFRPKDTRTQVIYENPTLHSSPTETKEFIGRGHVRLYTMINNDITQKLLNKGVGLTRF